MIGYLTNTSCNNKLTHKELPKLVDPRHAKVGSIQQNLITYSKLFPPSTSISKHHLMLLYLL